MFFLQADALKPFHCSESLQRIHFKSKPIRSKEMSSRRGKAFDKKSVNGVVVKGLSSVSITETQNASARGTGTQWHVFAWGVWKEIEQELYSKSHTIHIACNTWISWFQIIV